MSRCDKPVRVERTEGAAPDGRCAALGSGTARAASRRRSRRWNGSRCEPSRRAERRAWFVRRRPVVTRAARSARAEWSQRDHLHLGFWHRSSQTDRLTPHPGPLPFGKCTARSSTSNRPVGFRCSVASGAIYDLRFTIYDLRATGFMGGYSGLCQRLLSMCMTCSRAMSPSNSNPLTASTSTATCHICSTAVRDAVVFIGVAQEKANAFGARRLLGAEAATEPRGSQVALASKRKSFIKPASWKGEAAEDPCTQSLAPDPANRLLPRLLCKKSEDVPYK